MINLSKSGNTIIFEFTDNGHYLQNGKIECPVNSLSMVIDNSNMVTLKKSATNDIFISGTLEEFGMTKAELEDFYKTSMVGSTGGGGGDITSGEVQTMIDESISGKADTSAVTEAISAATADYFDGAEYDSGTTRINFYHGNTIKAYIDASAFIVDGMIDDVRIETISGTSYLVIDFNTASGKEDIQIPLTDIFDPNNYYDKNAIDGIVSGLNASIDTKLDASAYTPTDLSEYWTSAQTTSAIDAATSGKADTTAVTEAISAATDDMATQTWVGEQEYLTQDNLYDYYTKYESDDRYEKKPELITVDNYSSHYYENDEIIKMNFRVPYVLTSAYGATPDYYEGKVLSDSIPPSVLFMLLDETKRRENGANSVYWTDISGDIKSHDFSNEALFTIRDLNGRNNVLYFKPDEVYDFYYTAQSGWLTAEGHVYSDSALTEEVDYFYVYAEYSYNSSENRYNIRTAGQFICQILEEINFYKNEFSYFNGIYLGKDQIYTPVGNGNFLFSKQYEYDNESGAQFLYKVKSYPLTIIKPIETNISSYITADINCGEINSFNISKLEPVDYDYYEQSGFTQYFYNIEVTTWDRPYNLGTPFILNNGTKLDVFTYDSTNKTVTLNEGGEWEDYVTVDNFNYEWNSSWNTPSISATTRMLDSAMENGLYIIQANWMNTTGKSLGYKIKENPITSGEAQTMIDESISGKADTSAVTEAISAATSGKVDTSSVVTAVTSASTDSEIPTAKAVYDAVGSGGGGKAVSGGTNISITTGATADTINCTLPISADTRQYGTNLIFFNDINFLNHNKTKENFIVGYYNYIGNNFDASTNNYIFGSNNRLDKGFGQKHTDGNFVVGNYNKLGENNGEAVSLCKIFGNYLNPKNDNEILFGQYNNSVTSSSTFGDSGNTLFSVGNGTADNARHNAFEIRQNGDIYLSLNGQDVKLQDQLGGSSITVDTALDSGSTNPVENRVIYNKIDEVEEVTAAALNNLSDNFGGLKLMKLTQNEYNALSPNYDSNTLYVIVN